MRMFSKFFIATAVTSVLAGSAIASPLVDARYTTTTIDPGAASNFAGASYTYDNKLYFDPTTGSGSYVASWNTLATSVGTTLNGLGTVGAPVPPTFPDGAGTYSTTVTTNGNAGDGYEIKYSGSASSNPGDSFITTTTAGGIYGLDFSGGGSYGPDEPGIFDSVVKILGDYSSLSTDATLSYDSAYYTLVQNFVYDAGTGYTSVEVKTTTFDGTDNPDISFSLSGQAVPEPGGLSLAGLALMGVFAWRRRGTASRA
jgi:hypothetical protein